MEINSFLTGKRGVSLPFTDYCEPIIEEGIEFQDLLNPIIGHGKKSGWKYVELRGAAQYLSGKPCSTAYYGHILDLSAGHEKIFSIFRDSTRRNVKKAGKEKVEVRIEDTAEAMGAFCRLNSLTRREHGLPPQPRHFFAKLQREVISKKNGFVALAYHQGKAIAGNLYFHYGRQGVFKYGASDKRYQSLRAGNLVMWEAIKQFCREGFKSLFFERTEPENDGLRQFKSGWGTEQYEIPYFEYNLREDAFVPGKKKGQPIYNGLFRATPAPILKVIGSLLYRHMG
jgi:lipid II:glycine glycyltransferase (peptidoglycan interpeptide bridge formation enzyme)